jgi:O-acetylserine/cysteine efflux transporter
MTATADAGRPLSAGISPLHFGLLFFIQLFWGINWVAAKISLAELSPALLTSLRFMATFAVTGWFMRWHPGRMRWLLAGGFVMGALHFVFGFAGLALAKDIAPLAIASNLAVPFATVLSVLFLGDRIGAWRTAALMLAFGGILLMSFDPRVFDYGMAVVLVAISAFLWAIGTLFLRQVGPAAAYDLQGWISLCAWPPLLAYAFAFEPAPFAAMANAHASTWWALAFTVVCTTLVGHAGFYFLLQRYPMTLLAPYLLLSPFFAALGGMVWFGDVLTWRMVVGGLLTLLGVFIITWREAKLRAEQTREAAATKGATG